MPAVESLYEVTLFNVGRQPQSRVQVQPGFAIEGEAQSYKPSADFLGENHLSGKMIASHTLGRHFLRLGVREVSS
jgi:hypothetical protein